MILNKVRDILFFFERKDYRKLSFVVMLMSLSSVLEIVGISSIMPFVSAVANVDSVIDSEYYRIYLGWLNLNYEDVIALFGTASIFLLALGSLSKIYSTRVMLEYGNNVGRRLIIKIYTNYLYKDYLFFSNSSISEISKNINQETSRYTQNVFIPLLRLLSMSIFLLLTFILLLTINVFATFIVIFSVVSLYLSMYVLFRTKLYNNGKTISIANKERFRIVSESFIGIKETKVLKLEEIYKEQFSKYSEEVSVATASSQTISTVPKNIIELILFGSVMLVIVFLSKYGLMLTYLPVFTIFIFCGYKTLPALQAIYNSLVLIRSNISSIDSIEEKVKSVSLNKLMHKHVNNTNDDNIKVEELDIKNVCFSYNNELVLKNINLSFRKGDIVAIVGKSGSGKTTLMDIISGLIEPDSGNIYINGIKFNPIEFCSYVPQMVHLINGSIKDNITISKSDVNSIQNLENSLKYSCLDHVVESFARGLDTNVGENGNLLSGGQKQRVGLARAIYHDKPIILFDEATSALDPDSKKIVLESFASIAKDKILIIITHDMDTLSYVNSIIEMRNGHAIRFSDLNEYKFKP